MINPVPRVAAIHALAGFGRASLTAVTPVLSTMGCQVCPFPTAVLSTHGGFKGCEKVDLTGAMGPYMDHWEHLCLSFEAVYTGFLASPVQIKIVEEFIRRFSSETQLVVVDPVLGDDGKVYGITDEAMIDGMRSLIRSAKLITPNLTEAAFLLQKQYATSITKDEIKTWLCELGELGPEMVIITSVPLDGFPATTAVAAYNKKDGRFWRVNCGYVPASYPGTGDIFTSVVTGSLLQGDSLPIALDRAVQFVSIAIRASFGYTFSNKEGVLLERVLNNLRAPVTASTYEIID